MYPGLMRSLDRLLTEGALLSDPFTLPAAAATAPLPPRPTLRPIRPPPPPPPPPNPDRLEPALEAARDWRPSARWLTSDCLDWRRSGKGCDYVFEALWLEIQGTLQCGCMQTLLTFEMIF